MPFRFLLIAVAIGASVSSYASEFEGASFFEDPKSGQDQVKCEKYLTSDTFAFKPEPGSIEDRNPGTIARLLETRAKINVLKKVYIPFPDTLPGIMETVVADLKEIRGSAKDRRLQKLITDYLESHSLMIGQYLEEEPIGIYDFKRKTSVLYASLWELTVANLFQGEEVIINSKVSKIHPGKFTITPKGNILTPSGGVIDREIDIATRTGDRWRWIEVKDWSVTTASEVEVQDKLKKQSLAQDQLRRMLDGRVELVLLVKYQLGDELLKTFKETFPFDQISHALTESF